MPGEGGHPDGDLTYTRDLVVPAVWLDQGMLDVGLGQEAIKDGAGALLLRHDDDAS